MNGKVYQINIKPKKEGERGLPKFPANTAVVVPEGLQGDYNKYRHEFAKDNLDMAVLLMPLETILRINQEGWPIKPGDLGENFTTQGVDYVDFIVGNTYRIGAAVQVQISKPCDPCKNLYLLPYVGIEKGPWFVKALHERRGWYARVLKGGRVNVGDSITTLD